MPIPDWFQHESTIAEDQTRALEHIDRERLMAAPGCGLGMLTQQQVRAKLANMVKAAQTV